MFVVTDADAAAIRASFRESGELSAAIEQRRRFPGITDKRWRGSVPGPARGGSLSSPIACRPERLLSDGMASIAAAPAARRRGRTGRDQAEVRVALMRTGAMVMGGGAGG